MKRATPSKCWNCWFDALCSGRSGEPPPSWEATTLKDHILNIAHQFNIFKIHRTFFPLLNRSFDADPKHRIYFLKQAVWAAYQKSGKDVFCPKTKRYGPYCGEIAHRFSPFTWGKRQLTYSLPMLQPSMITLPWMFAFSPTVHRDPTTLRLIKVLMPICKYNSKSFLLNTRRKPA